MPADYFVPNAILEMRPLRDHLEAIRENGSRNTVYPVGPNRFLDRNFWAEVSFTRDDRGGINRFTYSLASQRFRARKLGP